MRGSVQFRGHRYILEKEVTVDRTEANDADQRKEGHFRGQRYSS